MLATALFTLVKEIFQIFLFGLGRSDMVTRSFQHLETRQVLVFTLIESKMFGGSRYTKRHVQRTLLQFVAI